MEFLQQFNYALIIIETSRNFIMFKDDFQFVPGTLESLFAFFVLSHVRHHKIEIFRNYLHGVNSNQPPLWMQSR